MAGAVIFAWIVTAAMAGLIAFSWRAYGWPEDKQGQAACIFAHVLLAAQIALALWVTQL